MDNTSMALSFFIRFLLHCRGSSFFSHTFKKYPSFWKYIFSRNLNIFSSHFQLQHSWLGHSALAYLNIGPRVGIKGGLRVRGSPILHDVVRKATEKVSWPKHEYMSVLEGWRMGEGKEYGEETNQFNNINFWKFFKLEVLYLHVLMLSESRQCISIWLKNMPFKFICFKIFHSLIKKM